LAWLGMEVPTKERAPEIPTRERAPGGVGELRIAILLGFLWRGELRRAVRFSLSWARPQRPTTLARLPSGEALRRRLAPEETREVLRGLREGLGIEPPLGLLVYGSVLYSALREQRTWEPNDFDLSLFYVQEDERSAFYRRLRRLGYRAELRGRTIRLTSERGRLPVDLSFVDRSELQSAAVPHERASLRYEGPRGSDIELWEEVGLEDGETRCALSSRQDLYRFSKAWSRGYGYRPEFHPEVWDLRKYGPDYPGLDSPRTGPRADSRDAGRLTLPDSLRASLEDALLESERRLEMERVLESEALCWRTLVRRTCPQESAWSVTWLEREIRDWLWPEVSDPGLIPGTRTLGPRRKDLRGGLRPGPQVEGGLRRETRPTKAPVLLSHRTRDRLVLRLGETRKSRERREA